ncbi:MAG: HAMP domain-containing histidine kinase [Desulfovibrio sp.]|nr:HAMP domain-containing histidine kinase [Desulfovibrio sp.]
MNAFLQRLRRGNIVLPLRLHLALATVLTLTASSLVSLTVLFMLDQITGLGRDLTMAHVLFSALTLLLSGIALAWEAGRYIRPAQAVVDAAARVAAGDFSVRIPLPQWSIGIAEARSLIQNFNCMTQELERMARVEKDFTSNVSHEIKTPLSSIIGFAEILMEDGIGPQERQQYLALMHKEAQRLSRLAENILRLSRLDAQNILTRRECIAVDEQIRRCLILLWEKHAEKNIVLDMQMEQMSIESDPDLLEQLWLNLLENALKYSPAGKTLHVCAKATEESISVSIRDEGQGIPVDKQPYIWERFYQCEESHKEQGHGLGLSIVKSVTQVLGGAIACHSVVGRGTDMRVTLPKFFPQRFQRSH